MDSQFQLQPPSEAFIKPLLEVREHYAREVARCDRLLKQALDNLHHVEGLLGVWPSSESNVSVEQHATIIEPTVNTTQSTAQASPDITADAPISSTTTKSDNITQLSFNWVEPLAQGKQIPKVQGEDNNSVDANTQQHQPDSTPSKTSSKPYQDIPILPEYAHMTRTEAIQKFLQQHIGTVCHIDFIVIKLYGHLDPIRFKIVRDRVRSTLYYGVAANRWYADPDDPTCYTLDLSLVRPSHTEPKKSKNKTKQHKTQPPQPSSNTVPMLPEFKGQFLIDALTYLLEENPGLVFNVAELIQAIYGELNALQLRQVRPKVLKELSRGYRTGRFSKLPGQIGLYTTDASLIT